LEKQEKYYKMLKYMAQTEIEYSRGVILFFLLISLILITSISDARILALSWSK